MGGDRIPDKENNTHKSIAMVGKNESCKIGGIGA
jgi:hypothetical protein